MIVKIEIRGEIMATAKKKSVKILEMIDEVNKQAKIKIRPKKKTEGYSIYLEFVNNNKRDRIYIDKSLHLTGTPKTLVADRNKLARIVGIRNERENELLKNETGFSLLKEKDRNFIAYFKEEADKKKNDMWIGCYKHFITFMKTDKLDLKKVDYKICSEFYDYLQSKVKPTTANTYISKLKAALNKLVKDGVLLASPAVKVSVKKVSGDREFLSIEEVQLLSETHKPNIDTCNAFLFSCFTGIRLSDIRALTFNHVDKDGYIQFKQQKTKEYLRMKLNDTAKAIYDFQLKMKRSDNIFNLCTISGIERQLKKWSGAAGITKHVTFHVGRHTMATLALTNDIDLYAISKLLGHKDIKETKTYVKLIDKKKDEAIDKMPNIKL